MRRGFVLLITALIAATVCGSMQAKSLSDASQAGITSPHVSVSTNAVAWGGAVFNLAPQVQIAEHYSVQLPIMLSCWEVSNKHALRIFAVQPECRRWFCSVCAGHFIGVHATVATYNLRWNRDRYQDYGRPALGAGLSYGYLLPLSKSLSLEMTLGLGYLNTQYHRYYNIHNGALIDNRTTNYWGIDRLGISLVYTLGTKWLQRLIK